MTTLLSASLDYAQAPRDATEMRPVSYTGPVNTTSTSDPKHSFLFCSSLGISGNITPASETLVQVCLPPAEQTGRTLWCYTVCCTLGVIVFWFKPHYRLTRESSCCPLPSKHQLQPSSNDSVYCAMTEHPYLKYVHHTTTFSILQIYSSHNYIQHTWNTLVTQLTTFSRVTTEMISSSRNSDPGKTLCMKSERLLGIWEFGENRSRECSTFLMAVKQVTRVHSFIARHFESKERLVHCVY
jgi:hypothetical protein